MITMRYRDNVIFTSIYSTTLDRVMLCIRGPVHRIAFACCVVMTVRSKVRDATYNSVFDAVRASVEIPAISFVEAAIDKIIKEYAEK
jgi:hypothetical protein